MNASQTIADSIPFAIPILSIATAVPLVAQKVPRNWWYGFRTRKTLSDDGIWYRANYLGGLNLLYAGILTLLINSVLAMTLNHLAATLIGSAVVAIAMGTAMAISLGQLRRL